MIGRRCNLQQEIIILQLCGAAARAVEHRSNIHARTNPGGTALHCAVGSGDLSAPRILLRNGANVLVQSNDGETAGDRAKFQRRRDKR